MKQLVTLLVLGILAFAAFRFGAEHLKATGEAPEALGISTVLDSHYKALLAPLNQYRPIDLTPPLEALKAQILNKQAHSGTAKQPVYNQAITLLDAMSSLAEERTKALTSLLRTLAMKSALDNPAKTGSTSAFFTQSIMKRWEDEKSRRKPAVDQMFKQLHALEAEWNKRLKPDAPVERYPVPPSSPVYISAKQ